MPLEDKKIYFLMPRKGSKPIGGFKVVYEYANRLVQDGFNVSIVYPAYIKRLRIRRAIEILRFIKSALSYIITKSFNNYSCKRWYKLDSSIAEKYIWNLESLKPQEDSILIATAATTAPILEKLKGIRVKKYYFIQHFENWAGAKAIDVLDTYKLNLKLITISQWLQRRIQSVRKDVSLVPNGFNTSQFQITIPPKDRVSGRILMLYHPDKWKGCDDAIAAFEESKAKINNCQLVLFGAVKPPTHIQNRYEYHFRPSPKELTHLYNSASIFIGASHSEGWGLTIGEAMLCGCAVACTENDGYMEMAINGQNALTSPIGDIEKLSKNIIKLVTDKDLRTRLALKGHQDMQKFEISLSYNKFKESIGL